MQPLFRLLLFTVLTAMMAGAASSADESFRGFVNKGLVGVGRLPAETFDRSGGGRGDTISGFSALAVDRGSLKRSDRAIFGTLYSVSDSGFGGKSTDYRPRIQAFDFSLEPYDGPGSVAQTQIRLTNTATIFLTDPNGAFFTGADPGSPLVEFPQTMLRSPGRGRRSLDAEGLVLHPSGDWWIADEFGPFVHRFDHAGKWLESWRPPDALLPRSGARIAYSGKATLTSGRRENRGFEGLTLTPDGKRLVAILQSPAVQDGGERDDARNTRLVEFDADSGSPTYGRPVAEYIYQLTYHGNKSQTDTTLVSEIAAIDRATFLVLERDSRGRGDGKDAPLYKRVVLISTSEATNIAGTAYDLAAGNPSHANLPVAALPAGIRPVFRRDFVDLLDARQLRRFGLTAGKNPQDDPSALAEKWESLALVPWNDPAFPNDWILLVGNDNDYKAREVFLNGQRVEKNKTVVDPMLLAYRLTLMRVKKGL